MQINVFYKSTSWIIINWKHRNFPKNSLLSLMGKQKDQWVFQKKYNIKLNHMRYSKTNILFLYIAIFFQPWNYHSLFHLLKLELSTNHDLNLVIFVLEHWLLLLEHLTSQQERLQQLQLTNLQLLVEVEVGLHFP